mmetsp:Transcript_48497/g.77592  ORF Transcript_48497/g.77592 Transcript_48497/m.77592 type:complete len:191 (-) Transcript_48497:86-658(-)|eukprot:CAMPEP_0197053404 /NCGR_PEP_ID=MMETSP1384-20130603/27687_1 /TAXON_ID=29189 /ORGANISM="Ammonia sp." /LENGTH=190 /DNA_ID=CAMNT_0042486297 /DNA_START=62 /DNA_END=634 /DNA_ORIENTATION=+
MDAKIMRKVRLCVYGYLRQQIENKNDLLIPMDVQSLCLLYSKDLLFVTFKYIPLAAAQKAVSNLTRKQLNEIKCMKRPPTPIKLTLNAVVLLLGKQTTDWRQMQKLLSSPDFIPSILSFNTNQVKSKTVRKVKKTYLSDPQFTFKRVNKASKAAAPLVLWVRAQMEFANLSDSKQTLDELEKQMIEFERL